MTSTQLNFCTFAAKQARSASFAASPALAQQACTPYEQFTAHFAITGAMTVYKLRDDWPTALEFSLDAPDHTPLGGFFSREHEATSYRDATIYGFSTVDRPGRWS